MTLASPDASARRADATRRPSATVSAGWRRLLGERRRLGRAYGHEVDLDVYHWAPERIVRLLAAAGLVESARPVREPDATEASPQGFVLARSPRRV